MRLGITQTSCNSQKGNDFFRQYIINNFFQFKLIVFVIIKNNQKQPENNQKISSKNAITFNKPYRASNRVVG